MSAAVHSRAGLGRYSEKLAASLIGNNPNQFSIFYNQGADGAIPASLAGVSAKSVQWGYKPWRMWVLMNHLARRGLNKLVPDAQLFHSTEHLLMPLRGVPTVLTIHDLIFKLFPEYHKKLNYWYLNWAVPIYADRADRIITISQASKRDIVTHYGVAESKIRVVEEAAAEHFRPIKSQQKLDQVKRDYSLPDNYLLHISTIEPRKNLSRLVDALKILRRDHADLHLLLVGSKGWLYDDFFAKLEAENLTDVVRSLGWVEDEDLPAVIQLAKVGVQPSLYEGFGLPILEHMSCGQAVAASNASSLPEVGGDAAVYYDPKNVEEMAGVIGRILNNPDERQHRIDLGLAQSARFSWQRTAQETLDVYHELV